MNRASLVVSVLFIVLCASFGQQRSEWKGNIEYDGEIKIIINPAEPVYGEIEFELEEDLTIGDEYEFPFYNRGIWFDVDSDDNMVILDREHYCVLKFDKEGKHVTSFGKKGQGPGEFTYSANFAIDSIDNVYVNEKYEIEVFSSAGKHIRTIRSQQLKGQNINITKEGDIIATILSISPDRKTSDLVLYNSEGGLRKTIVSYPLNLQPRVPGFEIQALVVSRFCYSQLDHEYSVYGFPDKYMLHIINSSGDVVRTIVKDVPPIPLTRSLRNRLIEDLKESCKKQGLENDIITKTIRRVEQELNFPESMPYFFRIISDDKKRIYVYYVKLLPKGKRMGYFDVFSHDGYYLYKLKSSLNPSKIKNGYVYKMRSDSETGYINVTRYKIKNWNQIKSGIN